MAGIGFSLRKLFYKRGVFNLCRAYGYAGIITIGPMLMGVGLLAGVSFASRLGGMPGHSRELLNCMLTYSLLASLSVSSWFNIVISLGMVGALSIVRYRTAIKDPMDLLYLFWSISVGITLAAGLYVLALMTMIVMILIVFVFYHRRKKGVIYILVIHYEGNTADDDILRALSRFRYQVKSKTMRKSKCELTIELLSNKNGTAFMDQISEIPGVNDINLIQYNGEYNG